REQVAGRPPGALDLRGVAAPGRDRRDPRLDRQMGRDHGRRRLRGARPRLPLPRPPVSSGPCPGAWPSGKATGFGPVIPGSNPGAPAIPSPVTETSLAAVVMAAGQGARMRSETPKHLHPLLGRRTVAWMIDLGMLLGAD